MLTRSRKKQQIKNTKFCRSIQFFWFNEIAKSKPKVNEYDGLWYSSKCIQCYKTRKVIDRCPICLTQYTIHVDNVFLTQCQHTFCKKCFFKHLDSTSKKIEEFLTRCRRWLPVSSVQCAIIFMKK